MPGATLTETERRENSGSLLAPVLFEFRGGIQFDGIDADDFEFGTAGGTVDDLSHFQILVQGHVGPAFDALGHGRPDVGRGGT